MTASPDHRIEMIDLDLERPLHTAPKLFVCPACKQRQGVDIIFGMPTEELWKAEKRGEVVLGGCCLLLIGDPERQCLACRHQWQIARRPTTPQ